MGSRHRSATYTGGAGFDAQWAANFVHPVRRAIQALRDEERSMWEVRSAILSGYGDDAFRRVIYTELHDEVANGRARVPSDISPDDPGGWFARKRSTLGAALMLTAPGIPMIFQGQEFLEDEWFRDTDPLDWEKKKRFAGIFRMYQDLIRLRRNWDDRTGGLVGHHTNVNDADKMIAFHRWHYGELRDDIVVVANFANQSYDSSSVSPIEIIHAGDGTNSVTRDAVRRQRMKRRGGDRVDWWGRLRVPLRGEFDDLADVDWLPIPRQQRVELMSLGSPGHDAPQHVGEPSHRIDAVHLRGLDQGHRD